MKTIAWVLVVSLGLAAGVVGQEGSEALARARVLEEQEGDLAAAERAYRAVVEGVGADEVKVRAALRLGTLLWRLERREEARPWLERAVAAGGEVGVAARGVLDGDGVAVEQDAALAARVRDALARLVGAGPTEGDPEKDLRWLGEAAVPTIVRVLEERREAVVSAIEYLQNEVTSSSPGSTDASWRVFTIMLQVGVLHGRESRAPIASAVNRVQVAVRIAEFVWELGGSDAERFLVAAADDPDVRWRRLVAKASGRACDGTLGLARQLLDDDDPEGVVPYLVLQHADRLPVEAMLGALESPIDRVRLAAWHRLGAVIRWEQRGDVRDAAFAVIEPALQRALSGPDPATARSAFTFLCSKGAYASQGMLVLLDWLPRVPVFATAVSGDGPFDLSFLRHVVRAARALGPARGQDARSDRRKYVSLLAFEIARAEPEGATGPLLDLVELGYDSGFAQTAVKVATEPEELVRAAQLLDRCVHPNLTARELATRDLPASASQPLRARLLRRLADIPVGGRNRTSGSEECRLLLQAIARTRSADAPSILSDLVTARPDLVDWIVPHGVLTLADISEAEQVSTMLREVLLSPAIGPEWRNSVFACLVRRGDRAAVPLFPKAYELGLESSQLESQARRGAQWLLPSNQVEDPQTGYDDDGYRAVWAALLSSPVRDEVLADVAAWRFLVRQGRQGIGTVADLIAPVLARRLPVLLQTVGAEGRAGLGPSGRGVSLVRLAEAVARLTPAGDGPDQDAFRKAVATLLSEPAFYLDLSVALRLPEAAIPRFASELGTVLRRHASDQLARRMLSAGVGIDAPDLIAMLAHEDESRRRSALEVISPPVDPAVLRRVEELVVDPSSGVRITACTTLGRNLSVDSVAVLLNALQDQDSPVRDAAAAALERIRLYHEQRAFWDQFEKGISTSREAAAAKLLAQARPGEPQEQRLLALRSLGLLGAPEALPYLIEWTQDDDAEVATAAREAVAELHRRAGTEKR